MGRLSELPRSPRETVLARILTQVHVAIDRDFPGAVSSSETRFSKTQFSYDEPTVNQSMPAVEDVEPAFGKAAPEEQTKTKLTKKKAMPIPMLIGLGLAVLVATIAGLTWILME